MHLLRASRRSRQRRSLRRHVEGSARRAGPDSLYTCVSIRPARARSLLPVRCPVNHARGHRETARINRVRAIPCSPAPTARCIDEAARRTRAGASRARTSRCTSAPHLHPCHETCRAASQRWFRRAEAPRAIGARRGRCRSSRSHDDLARARIGRRVFRHCGECRLALATPTSSSRPVRRVVDVMITTSTFRRPSMMVAVRRLRAHARAVAHAIQNTLLHYGDAMCCSAPRTTPTLPF